MLLLYLYFNILLLLSYFLYLLFTVNQFSFTHFRYCVSTFSYKHMPQCKLSLYLKKAGLASRNIVHSLKKVILRCIGLCFNYHHLYLLSRLDQPLIQRIPAGLSSTVACLDITYNLRSTGKLLLDHPKGKMLTTLGARSFSVAAPKLWNGLPMELRQATSLDSFKS